MTLAEKLKSDRLVLDEAVKSNIIDNLTKFNNVHGITDEIFTFWYGSADARYGFTTNMRVDDVSVYDKEHHRNYQRYGSWAIQLPKTYENRKDAIEKWILSQGFVRVESFEVKEWKTEPFEVGKDYFKENFFFKMA